MLGVTKEILAKLFLTTGQHLDRAARLLQEAQKVFEEKGEPPRVVEAHRLSFHVALKRGDGDAALSHARDFLRVSRDAALMDAAGLANAQADMAGELRTANCELRTANCELRALTRTPANCKTRLFSGAGRMGNKAGMDAADLTTLTTLLADLHATLSARKRPEDVAEMATELLGDHLSQSEQAVLNRAARGSLKQSAWAFSSMMQEFLRPVPMERQVKKAAELFDGVRVLSAADCADPVQVEAFLRAVAPQIRKTFGEGDFKTGRLNRAARQDAALDGSRRQYNKRFRLLFRMEARLARLVRETQKYELTLAGKSALASRLPLDEFSRDVDTACFVAYFTARANLRSEFTIAGQQKPFDEVAQMLLNRCKQSQSANWWAIAHVWPEAETLAHLSDEQKGELLGIWFGLLQTTAQFLREVYDAGGINRQTLVVRRGNDSSTWNQMARAWNKSRTNWINLLHALQMQTLLAASCPGKVLPLIAADVAAWHYASGGGPSPDLAVWNELPLPWDVLEGQATSGRADVEAACKKHEIDPIKSGWTGPRPPARAAAFRPTPELVHGVTVSSPFLAETLRKAGAFSAQTIKPDVLEAVPPLQRTEENGRVIFSDGSKLSENPPV